MCDRSGLHITHGKSRSARFTSTLDPEPRSREVFWFHRPETLMRWIGERAENDLAPTLRHRLRMLPALHDSDLWPAQARAIRNLEESLGGGPSARLDPDGDRIGQDATRRRTSPTG